MTADPATRLRKSRRRIACPRSQDYANQGLLQQGFVTDEMGLAGELHSSDPEPLMSALGQKQTLTPVNLMSALPPKADIALRRSECPLCAAGSTGQCNTACSLSAGVSNPKVLRGTLASLIRSPRWRAPLACLEW